MKQPTADQYHNEDRRPEPSYNGWKNYETWLCAIWIDNEEWMQEEARGVALRCGIEPVEDWPTYEHLREHYARPGNIRAGRVTRLADSLKAWIDDMEPELGGAMWADLLRSALERIDWREVAEHYTGDVPGFEATEGGSQ